MNYLQKSKGWFPNTHSNPSAFHVLFFHPSPEGWAESTGGQAAGHQSNKRSADGSNVLRSVHIQEVCGEDLTLGGGCASQQHIQDSALQFFTQGPVWEQAAAQHRGNSRNLWGWDLHTLVCPGTKSQREEWKLHQTTHMLCVSGEMALNCYNFSQIYKRVND